MNENESLKFKNNDFDFLLKQKMVEWLDLAISKSVNNDLRGFFQTMKHIRSLIPYELKHKAMLDSCEERLAQYFDSLGSANPSRRDQIILANQQKKSLLDLLDFYFAEVIRAYSELGLWLSVKIQSDDFDLMLSDENFNDELGLVKDKADFLKGLSVDDLLSFMSANMVHEVFAKVSVSSALKDE